MKRSMKLCRFGARSGSVTSAGLHPADASAVGQGVEVMRMNGNPRNGSLQRVRRKDARASKDEVAPVAHVGRVEDLIFNGNAHW